MGTWITMPLLSTLAALIIIVHSLEEGMESSRYDRRISPRLLNSESTEYDQPWRSVDVDPMIQESAPVEDWHENSPQEPPKRRRPGRKRKRRPYQLEEASIRDREGAEFEERIKDPSEESESQVVYETTELPRRRRKRPEMRNNFWNEEATETHRPTRRRGQRRRRPINRDTDEQLDIAVTGKKLQHRPMHNAEREFHEEWNSDEVRHQIRPTESRSIELVLEDDNNNKPNKKSKILSMGADSFDIQSDTSDMFDEIRLRNTMNSNLALTGTKENLKQQKGASVEASSLKELLKRSDGASLSEILQQRNLSLADLLNGKERAISALQTNYPVQENEHVESNYTESQEQIIEVVNPEEKLIIRPEEQVELKIQQDNIFVTSLQENNKPIINESDKLVIKNHTTEKYTTEKYDKLNSINSRRRLPPGIRRRHRIRNPLNVTTQAAPYMSINNRRRGVEKVTNPNDSENIIENNKSIKHTKDQNENITLTTSISIPLTTESNDNEDDIFVTTVNDMTFTTILPLDTTTSTTENNNIVNITYSAKATTKSASITSSRAMSVTETPQEILHTEKTESAIPQRRLKISLPDSETRRQVLTNRLKKKRMKQKNIIDDSELEVNDVFSMANLVSASEFIAKIQSPDTTIATTVSNDDLSLLTLQDITMPDDVTIKNEIKVTKKKHLPSSTVRSTTKTSIKPVTEENAKFEIEEILKDLHSSARLSKILSERNMTLNELVEHRERGSSQVHLADIFQNTSNEINPPEPFLSKSSIEPISKETYPLRALLEANLHDPQNKILDTNMQYANIPIAMNFGNNVNENGENLGIVSLFNKFHNTSDTNKINIKTDSEGTPYFTSVSKVSTGNETAREGRGLQDIELHALKELFTNLRKDSTNNDLSLLESTTKDNLLPTTTELTSKVEILNDDSSIAVEDFSDDLQDLSDFENNIARISNEKLEVKLTDDIDTSTISGVLENLPSNAKSVTIATAAIAGITMLLFLLTYMGCKWKNQRNTLRRRESFRGERIPTPVFENRKLSKINSSNRSISPMLSNTNIYTMSTLDSRTGKESPDYMWDSLRKPFQ